MTVASAGPKAYDRLMLRVTTAVATALTAVTLAASATASDWTQWGQNPQHSGSAQVPGQRLDAILATFTYDPFVPQETAERGGNLLAHYPVPMVEGNSVYSFHKLGTWIPCTPPGSGSPFPCGPDAWAMQLWNIEKLEWQAGQLRAVWSLGTDWKPVPDGGFLGGWEPVFHPVVTADAIWMPGAGGALWRASKETGELLGRVSPFEGNDPNTYVAGGLAADAQGNVYYNAIQLASNSPWTTDVAGAWLVKATPQGTATAVPFSMLVASAPTANAQCRRTFSAAELPWPPSSTAVPSSSECGSQRPGINLIPAIAPDGTIYTASRAHFNSRYSYLIAVNPNLTPRWAASLRGILSDGCGVLLPPNGAPGGCRTGSPLGVDPATNEAPAGQVIDQASSSPVVLPDGAVLFGAYTRYNYSRGHLLKFSAAGQVLATYDFGWDITPAVWPRGTTYSIVLKDNHYDTGSYCEDPRFCPIAQERYDLTMLDAGLVPQWHYTNTNTQNCRCDASGSILCVPHDEDGFEWCVNQPAVDADGVVYANAEDGYLYAIGPDGMLRQRIFLNTALGAAYTPLSIGNAGLIYSQNYGVLYVVGSRAP